MDAIPSHWKMSSNKCRNFFLGMCGVKSQWTSFSALKSWHCEIAYTFWRDFFTELQKHHFQAFWAVPRTLAVTFKLTDHSHKYLSILLFLLLQKWNACFRFKINGHGWRVTHPQWSVICLWLYAFFYFFSNTFCNFIPLLSSTKKLTLQ